MAIYGKYIQESTIINEKDIYYNKDKFDSGEINLCFITGFSGSGKSTMANNMESKSVEKYELDDVIAQWNFSDSELKEYGDMICSFFATKAKECRVTKEEFESKCKDNPKYRSEYYRKLMVGFVEYSINYASSHKNKKYIVEGVEIYGWINPSRLEKFAVYIKGTSKLISSIRAVKRNTKNDEAEGFKVTLKDKISMFNAQYKNAEEKLLKEWYYYYKKKSGGK